MKQAAIAVCIFSLINFAGDAQTVTPVGPLPSARQLQWANMEFYLFVHFGPNTFTDLEWGKGTEHEEVFDPAALDCRQWCRIARAAGAKGIILTAKHHDGFCLWPSKYSTHTVAQSKWKNGHGDVLKELHDACKEYGLKMGVYLSPWDRNHPAYGTTGYNDVYADMMKEIVQRYGPFFEFWWDGANGKKQVYDFARFEKTLRAIAPNTCVFSDIGPDIRWAGNEKGVAGKTNWDLLDTAGFTRGAGAPPSDSLNMGNQDGKNWIPAECDVSIRPGWFYHTEEDSLVRSPENLFELYLKSVGRGASLLLNVPPDRRGLISGHDSAALMGFKKYRDASFSRALVDQKFPLVYDTIYTIPFGSLKQINCIVLKEPIQFGQRIRLCSVHLFKNGKEVKELNVTTIGHMRILTFSAVGADSLRVTIMNARAKPMLSEAAAYRIDDALVEKD
jgi:alpha-L-fucosidase